MTPIDPTTLLMDIKAGLVRVETALLFHTQKADKLEKCIEEHDVRLDEIEERLTTFKSYTTLAGVFISAVFAILLAFGESIWNSVS